MTGAMKQPSNIFRADKGPNRFPMQRFLKIVMMLVALAAGTQLSHGFALLGPFETYQVAALGYGWDVYFQGTPGGVVGYSDLGGPHNIAEEFRRNTPVLYYAFDDNFLEYFGSNGVAAVDQAFAIMNSLTNVSMYSPDLSEFPLQSQRLNYEAQNLALTDVKSLTLHLLVQQLGLDQPDRYTWTLKNRSMGTPCPLAGEYLVIMRNFPLLPSSLQQQQYSPYVNGTLYSYGIIENCTGPLLAYTVPYAVDALADTYTAVADEPATILTGLGQILQLNVGSVGLKVGGYYTYLTRDDVGGLRYLLQTNNINLESSGPDTVQFVTNNFPQILTTQDLGLLAALAPTNSAAQLQALYPGLVVNDISNYFAAVPTTNISLVITPAPFAPAGSVQVKAVTTVTTNIVEFFIHTFGNIYTNSVSAQSVIKLITPSTQPFSPAGSPPTGNKVKTIILNQTAGDFFLLPTNVCAIQILDSNLLTTVVATTNILFTSTNIVSAGTNTTGGTTSNTTLTVSVVTYFTNHVIEYLPITCPADTVTWRQGIESVHFVRRDFDSLIGTFWAPATNDYTLVEFTNSVLRPQMIRRVVTQPDFLFTAADLAEGPLVNPFPTVDTVRSSAMVFNQVASNGLAGPGTIQSPTTFTFNKVGALNFNYAAATLAGNTFFVSDQSSAIQGLVWASFDGTTNEPVVYPNGTSINNLINQLVIQVQPPTLPDGAVGADYSFVYTNSVSGVVYTNTFSATGGQGPFTWALAPNSAGLPAGLVLTSDGQLTGTPSGPVATYDFTIRATDANSRTVDIPYSINITP